MKKAFTLIELLVVIAIIAILAAILFPVFAQAKAAAKKTASLSNAKQMALACLGYAANNNDGLPLGDSYSDHDLRAHYGNGNKAWRVWTELIYGFTKNGDLFTDPMAPQTIPSPAEVSVHWYSSWGYNYFWLSPSYYTNGSWSVTGTSQSSLANPAATVMLTAAGNPILETGSWWRSTYGPGADGVPGPTTVVKVDPPDINNPAQYGFQSWGYTTSGIWYTAAGGKYEAGAYTGGVAVRAGNGCIVAFVDGHVKRLSLGELAGGTNFWINKDSKTGSAPGSIAVNDTSKYLWDNL